jgi:hypothetical protein
LLSPRATPRAASHGAPVERSFGHRFGFGARALTWVVCLLSLCAGVGGCTKVPELSGMTSLLTQQETGAHGAHANTVLGPLTLDQLQVKGSHNSYHQAPRVAFSKGWRYSHLPLAKQLETQGVRQIELDVRYSGGQVVVGHLPVVDSRTSCRTLKTCLQQLKTWSSEHPSHLPVFVFIEPKEHVSPSNLDGRLEVLDQTITSVFSRRELLLPEQVAGDASSLREGVQRHGWPSLDSVRGKVVFVLFGRENHTKAYAQGRPRLQGRVMFAAGKPEDSYAVFASHDNPLADQAAIERSLAEGMLVRTRADSDLQKKSARRDAALASGAHFIGSDFVDPKQGWLELGVRSPARCNPRSASTGCVASALVESSEPVVALGGQSETPAAIP